MTPLRPRLALLLVPFAVAACGGSTPAHSITSSSSALQRVLTSAQKMSTTSYSMTMSLTSDVSGLSTRSTPTHFTIEGSGDVASAQRMSLTFTEGSGAKSMSFLETVYDGTIYISSDHGASYRSLPFNAAAISQAGAGQALQMLQNVAQVTDTGPSTIDGQTVETYHAVLDDAKLKAMMGPTFSSLFGGSKYGNLISSEANAMTIRSSSIDVALNDAGLPVRESFAEDVSMDLSAIASQLGSSAAAMPDNSGTVEYSLTGTISARDFGKPVTVTKPTNVIPLTLGS